MIHKKNSLMWTSLILLLVCSPLLFSADLVKPPPPVSLKFAPAAGAKPGSTVDATIEVAIKKPWHIFGENPGMQGLVPAEFTLESCAGATLEKVALSKPTSVYSKIFEKNLSLYEEKMTVTLTLKIASEARGRIPLNGSLRYQACSDTICLPPKREPLVAEQLLEAP